ncbi:hypothetical protein M758_8G169700 [Ceratodon purpureus]|nr:hypothetical protein M758_8G169700 [Ceratodon purpureus]
MAISFPFLFPIPFRRLCRALLLQLLCIRSRHSASFPFSFASSAFLPTLYTSTLTSPLPGALPRAPLGNRAPPAPYT